MPSAPLETVERVNVMQPVFGAEELAAVAEVLASGWVAQGPKVAAFEAAFADHQRTPAAVAVSSCTAALHLAMVVIGVRRDDEVVVPSLSFIATANAVRYVGARPRFCDVDPISGNVTAATIEPMLSARTKAVIVVDQGGMPVDLAPIRALCDARGVLVVEDAACAAGSTYDNRPVGATAEIAAWSFHPRKVLTTGEGGMLTTRRTAWADRARKLREHAMDLSAAQRHASTLAPPEHYVELGYNYRMTDIQAAIGIVQLARLSALVRRRREIAARYRHALASVEGLRLVDDPPYGTTNYQSCWVEVDRRYPLSRDELLARLADSGISARRGIMAIHRQPAYARLGCDDRALPVTSRLTDRTLILPVHHELTDAAQRRVIDVLRRPVGGRE